VKYKDKAAKYSRTTEISVFLSGSTGEDFEWTHTAGGIGCVIPDPDGIVKGKWPEIKIGFSGPMKGRV
jgi:hypothetical protein